MINGDPLLNRYIYETSVPLEGITALLLGSDGLIPQGWEVENPSDRHKMLLEINTGGFQRLLKCQTEERRQ
jgi:hypothetical protein